MKPKRLMTLILMTSLGAALFAWSHAQSKARNAIASASRQMAPDDDTSLVLAGTIGPAIANPIVGRNVSLAVPLNTPVKRGQVIGREESQVPLEEMDSARQELKDARLAERKAKNEVRQAESELGAIQAQTGAMNGQEVAVEAAEADAEREVERGNTALRSGLTSGLYYDAAITARDSAEVAANSIRSSLATASIETDEGDARTQEALAQLREATARRDAAEAVVAQMRKESKRERIVSPADGIVVPIGQSEGINVGIASDSQQLCAYAMVRQTDLMAVRIGQQSRIVLDERPAVTFHAKVAAISETPVDSPEGEFYQVTFLVDNPPGMWFSGAPMHARLVRSTNSRAKS